MPPPKQASPMTWMFGHQLRGKVHGIDRAPAGVVGRAGDLGDAAGLLRRDHVCDRRGVIAEIGDDGVGRGIDRCDPATLRQRHPLDHAGIELLPGILEQPLLRERVLGVEDEHFRARLFRLQIMRDQAGALVWRRWTARRARRHREHDQAAVVHGFELSCATASSARPPSRHAAFLPRPPRHSPAARRSAGRCRAKAPAGRSRARCRRRDRPCAPLDRPSPRPAR